MSIVNMIDRITKWAEENICENVRFKLPNDDNGNNGYSKDYELVKPSAFAMYVPASDRLPEGVRSQTPSLCVQLLEGTDNLSGNKGSMEIQLLFSTWDTGYHGRDIFLKKSGGIYENMPEKEAAVFYRRNGDGWRDAWNFVDTAIRVIESTENIDGIRIDKNSGIKYGTLKEQSTILDFYPLWFAWVSFSVEYEIVRNRPAYNEFL